LPFLFSRPDLYFARSGRLDATLVSRRISGAPGFMRGLRVLFASDFHVLARSTRADLDALAAKMAGAGPDLLLLGGDYSDVAGDAERLFRALGGVRPPLGAYGVLGNNDAEAWAGRLDRLAEKTR